MEEKTGSSTVVFAAAGCNNTPSIKLLIKILLFYHPSSRNVGSEGKMKLRAQKTKRSEGKI
jgi:hypothetical protein